MKNVFDFGEMLDVNGGAEMPVRRRIKLSCNKCRVQRYHNKQVLYVPRVVRTSVINLYKAGPSTGLGMNGYLQHLIIV